MKRIILNVLALVMFGVTSGCTDDFDLNGIVQPSLSSHYLHPTATDFVSDTSNAFSEEFKVETLNTSWKFSDVAEWFSLTPMEGSATTGIILSAHENKSAYEARTAVFYLRSADHEWDYSHAMSVSQAKATPLLEVNQNILTFGGAAAQQTLKVTSNCGWTVSCSDSWVSFSSDEDSGSIIVNVTSNPDVSYRSCSLYVNYGEGQSKLVSIKQSPSEISSTAYSLECENTASRYALTIDSETDWKSSVSDSWISVEPDNGKAGSTSVTIEVAPNTSISTRKGFVAISTGTAERMQIEVIQKGIYIEVDEELSFGSNEESKTVSIRSNTGWTVISKPNWISVSSNNGNGNGEMLVTSLENPNTSSRTGEMVIGQVGLSVECKITITQKGKYLSASADLLQFSDKSGEMNFNLKTDASWSSTVSAEWFSSTPSSGRGDTEITVSVEENTSTEERDGIIKYTYADSSVDVGVHQMAKYFTIDNETFEFESKGGTHTIEVYTNDEWTAEIANDVDWLSLSEYSGDGDALITMIADDNASVNVRSTEVFIKTRGDQSIRILVSQKPRYLTVSTERVLFFAKGGESEPIEVETNGTYKIVSDVEWISIKTELEKSFLVQVSENLSNESRQGKITVTLTDLQTGSLSLEIPVIQAGQGGSFILNEYPVDSDWNIVNKGSLTLTINGYSMDNDWNDASISGLTVIVTGYSTDEDWNKDDVANGHVVINPYGMDEDWNESSDSSSNIIIDGYPGDSDWNTGSDAGADITADKYPEDADWNTGGNTGADITTEKYPDDSNWNSEGNTGADISTDKYPDDSNWNSVGNTGADISTDKFPEDANWNTSEESKGDITNEGYPTDENWDDSSKKISKIKVTKK